MENFTPGTALLGGLIIGLASIVPLILDARVAGVSGIVGGAFETRGDERTWRLVYLAGLIAGGAMMGRLLPSTFAMETVPAWPWIVLSGLLVGAGTRIGNGCTSGHGICGISRLSPRSLVATGVFMFFAGVATWLTRHVMGGIG